MSDDLLRKTMDLFEPFQPDEPKSDEGNSQEAEPTPAEEATGAEKPEGQPDSKPVKSRRYEQKHPVYRFRIPAADNEQITRVARELNVSRDKLATAIVRAALDAIDEGHLELTVHRDIVPTRDALQRLRNRVQVTVTWSWTCKE